MPKKSRRVNEEDNSLTMNVTVIDSPSSDQIKDSLGFIIYKKDSQRLKAWLEEHDKTCKYAPKNGEEMDSIGARLTHCFTPTSIGVFYKVTCVCGEQKIIEDGSGF